MKKKIYLSLAGILLITILFLAFTDSSKKSEKAAPLEVKVKKGKFEVTVVTTGELMAENSENILGPNLRQLELWDGVKINDMVQEGTVVDSGQWVATLDRTTAESKLKDIETELQRAETDFTRTQLDTTLELRSLRDQLINLKFSVEEANLIVNQSIYEPQATIRQAKINLDKAERNLKQTVDNYKLKVKQSEAKMFVVNLNLEKWRRKKADYLDIMDKFDVKAPKRGMVIYARDWNGERTKAGSQIRPWDPTVAILPDLSSMVSKTYVNEIDISKIKVDQLVKIGVDAFPNKEFQGKVIHVANVGEKMRNGDAKVFEVIVRLSQNDTILRPAMTTNNSIITGVFENVLSVPIEAIQYIDSVPYMYIKRDGSIKKTKIVTGQSNENEMIVTDGVKENDIVMLNMPSEEKENKEKDKNKKDSKKEEMNEEKKKK